MLTISEAIASEAYVENNNRTDVGLWHILAPLLFREIASRL